MNTSTLCLPLFCLLAPALFAEPLPVLDLPGAGTDPEAIDYDALPRLEGDHAIIHPAQPGVDFNQKGNRLRLQLHNYLAYHDNRFWCIWSDGPKIEDWPTQEVKYSTSEDGLTWAPAQTLSGPPEENHAYIARGLWVRDGELLALAAYYRGHGAFGVDKELELRSFRWNGEGKGWQPHTTLYHDAINNFPPQKLPTGEWILTRRDSRFNVSILIGGHTALNDWQSYPVVGTAEVGGFRPDEPIFWILPGNSLNALFRDNGGSQRLFHATSMDLGKSWTTPALTNFPNATSKIFSIQTSRGYRILISNANPKLARRQLHLSISEEGKRFTHMAQLAIPTPPVVPGLEDLQPKFREGVGSLQYPHVIEHEGFLWIALSRNKVQTELFRVSLDAVDALLK